MTATPQPDDTDSVVTVGGIGALRFVTQEREDQFISAVLQRGEHWEPFESLLFRSLVRPGSLVCDIGANLGWYTVLAARLGARVVAAEPDPTTFALLEKNIRLNACTDVQTACVALADHAGRALLDQSDVNQGDHRILGDRQTGRGASIEVSLQRLDDLVPAAQVDVMKIDTQGSEAAILRGAQGVLARGLRAIFVEFWPHGLTAGGSSAAELLELLDSTGLSIFEIDPERWAVIQTDVAELLARSAHGLYSPSGEGHLNLLLLDSSGRADLAHLIAERDSRCLPAEILGAAERARVELTVACGDCAGIPKVSNAGAIERIGDRDAQIMHNGVRVLQGGYYGDWMTEIIRRLDGHHEPQEERVFHEVVGRVLESDVDAPSIVELGAFWSYYSLWFLRSCERGRAVLVEPDPRHLEVTRTNLSLNGADALVLKAAIGESPSGHFVCESGETVDVEYLTLAKVLDRADLARADIVVSDIQGFEVALLEEAQVYLAERVRFLVLSTHDVSISGRPDTHERCLELLRQCGAHIIAEHHIIESFSGDGLIAVSFDPRDRDMRVEVSHARAAECLFPYSPAALDQLRRHAANLEHALAVSTEYVHSLSEHLGRLEDALHTSNQYAASLEQRIGDSHSSPAPSLET